MKKLILFTVFSALVISANAGYRSISRAARNYELVDEYVTILIQTSGSFYLKLDVFSNQWYESYVCAQLREEDNDVLASVDASFYNNTEEIRLNASPYPYEGYTERLWSYFYLYSIHQSGYVYAVVTLTW